MRHQSGMRRSLLSELQPIALIGHVLQAFFAKANIFIICAMFFVTACTTINGDKMDVNIDSRKFVLVFGGDEFNTEEFFIPSNALVIEYTGKNETYYRNTAREYTLYNFKIISGEILLSNGKVIIEDIYIPLRASPDVVIPDEKGVSAAMIDKLSNEVIPIGRGVLSSVD